MTNSAPSNRARPSRASLALLGALALAAAVAGAYLDWQLWHPASGILVTIVAAALLVVGGLAWTSRWRRVRPVAAAFIALGVGALLGQNLGPSRPEIIGRQGTLRIQLTQPADAAEIIGPADCQLTDGGENFQISGDPNLRLQIGDQPREERDFVQVALARGDMWDHGAAPRDDRWSLSITIGDAGPFTDDQVPITIAMESDPDSQLEATGSQERGSLDFGGLAMDERETTGVDGPIELTGTIAWDCAG